MGPNVGPAGTSLMSAGYAGTTKGTIAGELHEESLASAASAGHGTLACCRPRAHTRPPPRPHPARSAGLGTGTGAGPLGGSKTCSS